MEGVTVATSALAADSTTAQPSTPNVIMRAPSGITGTAAEAITRNFKRITSTGRALGLTGTRAAYALGRLLTATGSVTARKQEGAAFQAAPLTKQTAS